MSNSRSTSGFTSAGILAAIGASLCCLTPAIGLFAGSSSIATNFASIEPARPYLISLSIAVLALAWCLKFKPSGMTDQDCNCETDKKASFIQSKTFLGMVTCFSIVMMAFPLYANMFYPKPKFQAESSLQRDHNQKVKFTIEGMTCVACEGHVDNELAKIAGVVAYKTSFDTESSLVSFDRLQTGVREIETAINKTGYQVISHEIINPLNPNISFYEAALVCIAPEESCETDSSCSAGSGKRCDKE